MELVIVVAMSKNRVIGVDGKLPWHLPADLKMFRQLTAGHPVIMGRKTFQSICERLGKPLPERTNIVMSKNHDFCPTENCVVTKTFSEAIEEAQKAPRIRDEAFIIGGESIFKLAMPIVDRMNMTIIYDDFSGDVFFPVLEPSCWEIVDLHSFKPDNINRHRYAFIEYKRLKRGKI